MLFNLNTILRKVPGSKQTQNPIMCIDGRLLKKSTLVECIYLSLLYYYVYLLCTVIHFHLSFQAHWDVREHWKVSPLHCLEVSGPRVYFSALITEHLLS